MIRFKAVALSISFTVILPLNFTAHASEGRTLEQAFIKCKNKYPSEFEGKKRLECFDSINGAEPQVTNQPDTKIVSADASTEVVDENTAKEQPAKLVAVNNPKTERTFLERKWRLTSQGDWNISDFETYKSNYLVITNSSNTNDTPSSPNYPNTPDRNLDKNDLKFQFSLKTELLNNIPLIRNLPYVTSSRLWAAYTQQSYWQVFNGRDSRNFRENNYEPELILSLGINNQIDGVKKAYIPRMLNLGAVHQSNGRENPLSRSWNYIYLQGGWELTDDLTLMLRPKWRLPENSKNDDNPDIEKYLGYGDATVRWENKARKLAATVLLRNNFRRDNKGFAQLDLQRQVSNDRNINLHLLLSTGYGESLLDYNHSQTMVGLGLSLGD